MAKFDDLSDADKVDALLHGAKYVMAEKRLVKSQQHQRFLWVLRLISAVAVLAATALVPWLVHLASPTVTNSALIAIASVVFVVSCWIAKRQADRTTRDVTSHFANKIAQDPATTLRGLASRRK